MPNFTQLLSTMHKLREQALEKNMVEQNPQMGQTQTKPKKEVDPLDADEEVVLAKTKEEKAKLHTKLVKKVVELKQIEKDISYGQKKLPTLVESLKGEYGDYVSNLLSPKQGADQASQSMPQAMPEAVAGGAPVQTPDALAGLRETLQSALQNYQSLNTQSAERPGPETVKPERLSDLQRFGPLAGALLATLLGGDPKAAGGLAGGITNMTTQDAQAAADFKNMLAQNAYKRQMGIDEAGLENAKMNVGVAQTALKEGQDTEEKRMVEQIRADSKWNIKNLDSATKLELAQLKTPEAKYNFAKLRGATDEEALRIAFSPDFKNLAAANASDATAEDKRASAAQRIAKTPAEVAKLYAEAGDEIASMEERIAHAAEINAKTEAYPAKMQREADEIAQGWAKIRISAKNAETMRITANANAAGKASKPATAALKGQLMRNAATAIQNQVRIYEQAQRTADALRGKGELTAEEYSRITLENREQINLLSEKLLKIEVPPDPK